MKMIAPNHFMCYFYCNFSVFYRMNLSGRTWCSGRSPMTSSDSVCKVMPCRFIQPFFDLVYHLYGICRMYSEENPQDFRLPVPRLYSWEWVMLLLNAEAAFKPGGSLFWEFTSEHLSQLLVLCRPSLAHEGSGYPIFRAELSVGVVGVYGIGSRCARWRICRLSVYCWLLHRTQPTLSPCLSRWDVDNDGQCWQYGHWPACLQTFPFPVQEPFWLWKAASDNPVYIGVRRRTSCESHPAVWWAFQGAWAYGAWASLSLKPSFFFSCSRTDRTLTHPYICYADALCQDPCNAGRYACEATRHFPKGASCL